MAVFSPDFASVDASIPIYEKGRYRVKTTKRTPFIKEKRDGDGNVNVSAGVRYPLEMVGKFDEEGELITEDYAGRTVTPFSVWVHTEGGWKFSKSFLMAAAGYDVKNEEELANKELFQKHGWIVNGEPTDPPENIEIGDGFDLCVGRLVDVTLTKSSRTTDDGREFDDQDFGAWAPVE